MRTSSLVDAYFLTVVEPFQVPVAYRCSPLFTDGLVHRWYIAGVRTRFIVDTVAPVAV